MQWQDVLADPSLQNLPYKIELNERGIIEMSPASFFHSRLQGKLAGILSTQLGGEVFTELAILTRKGVRVPDVAWGTHDYFQQHLGDICATSAPEICIEILSPSNSTSEMQEKTSLFLEAGAIEVWLLDEQGCLSVFDVDGQQADTRYPVDLSALK